MFSSQPILHQCISSRSVHGATAAIWLAPFLAVLSFLLQLPGADANVPALAPPTSVTTPGTNPSPATGETPAPTPVAANNLDPKSEEPSVTELRKNGVDLVGKILAASPSNRTVDLLIDGNAKLVDLIEVDKQRALHYKQFGKKGVIPFPELTVTQLAGILGAITFEEFEQAGEAHLTAGLMYAVIGKNLESSNAIAKAVQLDDRLNAVAQEQMKKLPKPPPPPNGPDLSGIANAFGGLAGVPAHGGGTAAFVSPPGGGNYPPAPVGPWKCMGFGGGGSIYTPIISPHDPKVGIVTSDMSGIYLTRDGGRHWQVLPRMRNGRGIAFHPTDPNVIFVGTISMIYRTADLGQTWKTVTTDYKYPMCAVWDCLVDPDDGNSVWAAFGRGTIEAGMPQMATKMQIERSSDGGNTFVDASAGLNTTAGMVRKMAVDRSTPPGNRTLYAVTSDGFYRSTNHGAAWAQFGGKGLPGKNMRDIVTLYDKAAHKTIILVIMETGGLFRSIDGGATFQPSGAGIGDKADGTGVVLNAIGASWVDHQIVWAVGADIWKSLDSGRTWKSIYDDATKYAGAQMVKAPWRHASGYGVGCSPKNPNVMWYTGVGHCIGTSDGGASLTELDSWPMPEGTPRFSFTGPTCWKICKTAPVKYDGGNLEVTNSYQVIPDPHNPKTWYACFADVGQWRTDDGGESWVYGMGWWNDGIKSEWRNSVYEIAPDPRKPGKLYQVCTNRHDLPDKDIEGADTFLGGVAISEDGGSNWRPLEKCGLPEKIMTSILIDKRSGEQNTLWVALYAEGVWRSTDDGGNFVNLSKGLPTSLRAWRLRQASDGSILLITVNQKPGGIFRFDEKSNSWSLLPATKDFPSVLDMITGPKGFLAVAVEASAAPAKGGESDGGIFASYDNGVTWKKLLDGSFKGVDRSADGQWWFAAGHRKGLMRSLDGGVTWAEDKELFFTNLNDVTINPKNPGELWLSTGGCGIFKGPATGVADTSTPSGPTAPPPPSGTLPTTSGISHPPAAAQ